MIKKGKKIFFEALKHPFMSGSVLMIGGSMIANVINYLYHLIMGRLLGPVSYGELVSLYSILYIISIIPISWSIAIVKYISSSKTSGERNKFYWTIKKLFTKISILLSFIVLLLAPVLSNFLHVNNLFAFLLVSPIMYFTLMAIVEMSSMQGVSKFTGVTLPNIISAFGKLVVGILLVFAGLSLGGVMLGVLVGVGFSYLVAKKMIKNIFGNEIKNPNYKLGSFMRYSAPVLLLALAFTSFFTVDTIFVKHFLSPLDAGIYSSVSVLGKIIYFAAQPISSVMFPMVSENRTSGRSYTKLFFASFSLTTFISFSIVTFYYLFPSFTINLLFGSQYLSAQSSLVLMGVFIAMYTMSYFLINFVMSLGRTRVVALPVILALLQIVGILIWHNSINQILMVNIYIVTALFFGLTTYVGYNGFTKFNRNERR